MTRIGMLLWCGFFIIPLIVMVVLDGFCSGKELCHAGLSFTVLIYGMGVAVFIAALLLSRLLFKYFHAGVRTRILTLKALLLIPLIPGLVVLVLLAGGFLGRL